MSLFSRRSGRSAGAHGADPGPTLIGRRVLLRSLRESDFAEWSNVRLRCASWLTIWEPLPVAGGADVERDPAAFASRCAARAHERFTGSGFGFGLFVDGAFAGEVNLNLIHRGAFQSAYLGYWIDERHAGNGYTPEAVVLVLRFAFEQLQLHRVQISILPRNTASRRVVEKLGLRDEGVAQGYLEINGVWEDHIRFAMTAEEWALCGDELMMSFVH